MEWPTNCGVAFLAQVLDHIYMAFSLRLLKVLLPLMISPTIYGAIVGQPTIGGASNSIKVTDNQWRVYGSFIGPATGEVDASDGTINNCVIDQTLAGFTGCNKKRVTGETILTVTFNEGTEFQGTRLARAYIVTNPGGATQTYNEVTNEDQSPKSSGATFLARLKWKNLCSAVGGTMATYGLGEACTDGSGNPLQQNYQLIVGVAADSGTGTISSINIDLRFYTPTTTLGLFNPTTGTAMLPGSDGHQPTVHGCNEFNGQPTGTALGNYEGYCDYKLVPGDNAIRVISDRTIANNLTVYNSNNTVNVLKGFVLFLSTSNFELATPWAADDEVTNLLITPGNSAGGFEQNTLTSPVINNGSPIFTRLATLDQANNITHLFGNNIIQANCSLSYPTGPAATSNDDLSDPTTYAYYKYFVGAVLLDANGIPTENPILGRCPYATVPNLVSGLLDKDINCFVATALTGSAFHYQVVALREFRDRFLKSFSLGQAFIDFYYQKGPKAAHWLNTHPQYKPAFRVLLWPVYFIAKIFNQFGALMGLVFLSSLLLLPFAAWKLQRKTFFQR